MLMEDIKDIPVCAPRYVLSVPIVATLLAKGQTQADIAKLFDVSQSAVSSFVGRHKAKLSLLDNFDDVMINNLKSTAMDAQADIAETVQKASFSQRMVGTGIAIDKMRLLQDKSTANVSVRSTLDDIDKQIKDMENCG